MTSKTYERGLEMRKKVMGAARVEEALANADEFTQPLEELMTEYCWGAVMSRPGLAPNIRSMLNLAMLTALNRPAEFKLQLEAALNNGVTREEIGEVLLQAGIYCGLPAAVDSFRIAQEVFKERGI